MFKVVLNSEVMQYGWFTFYNPVYSFNKFKYIIYFKFVISCMLLHYVHDLFYIVKITLFVSRHVLLFCKIGYVYVCVTK